MNIDEIARVAHEVNRAYCEALGDVSQLPWDKAPFWQIISCRDGVYFLLDNPEADVSALHENWLKMKRGDGWIYGLVKDSKAKTHPCFVEFNALPADQRAKNSIFRAVVKQLELYSDAHPNG